jgi:hypothetical protein
VGQTWQRQVAKSIFERKSKETGGLTC